jgi:hypothetical protein
MAIEKVVFSAGDNVLRAYNPDLTEKWTFTDPDNGTPIRGVAIGENGDVYRGQKQRNVARIAGDGSSKVWSNITPSGDPILVDTAPGGEVFVLSGSGITKHDRADGSEFTTDFPITDAEAAYIVADGNGNIYYAESSTGNGNPEKASASDASVLWTASGSEGLTSLFDKSFGFPVATYVESKDQVHFIDDTNGSYSLSNQLSFNISGLGAISSTDAVAFSSTNIVRVDDTGSIIWSFSPSFGVSDFVGDAAEGVGFAISGDGSTLGKIDLDNGQVSSTTSTGGGGASGDVYIDMQVVSTTTYSFSGAIQDEANSSITVSSAELEQQDGTVLDSQSDVSDYSLSADFQDGDLPTDLDIVVTDPDYKNDTTTQTVDTGTTSYTNDFSLALPDVAGKSVASVSTNALTFSWTNNDSYFTDAALIDPTQSYSIGDVNTTDGWFQINDVDLSGNPEFAVGETIDVDGSTGNDGFYTISSVTTGDFDAESDGTDTRIHVEESVTDSTTDGSLRATIEKYNISKTQSQVQFTGLADNTTFTCQLRYTNNDDNSF